MRVSWGPAWSTITNAALFEKLVGDGLMIAGWQAEWHRHHGMLTFTRELTFTVTGCCHATACRCRIHRRQAAPACFVVHRLKQKLGKRAYRILREDEPATVNLPRARRQPHAVVLYGQ